MLWADKYRPRDFASLDFHKEQALSLKTLTQDNDFPHLLFYGALGSGKKTLIMCLLRELFGSGVDRLKMETLNFTTPSNKKIEINTVASNFHIELSPSDVGIHDKVVIMDVIKNIAQTQQLSSTNQRDFKIIVLTDVESLTKDAQNALRRTMEKYAGNCRLILSTSSFSKVIPAIRSRCLLIRVPAPSQDEIKDILKSVCTKERFEISNELLANIAIQSNSNLRRALLMCETIKTVPTQAGTDPEIIEADWAVAINNLVTKILQSPSIPTLTSSRETLYELLIFGIPSELIFRNLLHGFLKNCDADLSSSIIDLAAHYEHAASQGNKEIIHLEAFLANVMCLHQEIFQNFMEGEF